MIEGPSTSAELPMPGAPREVTSLDFRHDLSEDPASICWSWLDGEERAVEPTRFGMS